MKYLLAISVVFCSCGRPQNVDPELQQYVDSFEECIPHTDRIDAVVFGEMFKDGAQGYCDMRINPTKRGYVEQVIVIDRAIWNDLPEISRKALMFHEMLHCVDFKLDLYEAKDYKDWMYWQGVPPEVYEDSWVDNEAKYCKR
jgi:hypothetical protein